MTTRATFLTILGLCSTITIVAAGQQTARPTPPPSGASMPQMSGMAMPSDADLIKSATAAAPAAISQNATVVTMDDKMQMKTLRTGTNGWTCMPDMPSTPGTDPMCLDQNGLEWASAWMAHKDPPADKMGLGYMLMGGSDASNSDPFATQPAPNGRWVDTGPHIMVFNIGTRFAGYPTTSANTKVPYVMFPNTPYAHLMVPVQ